MCMEVDNSYGVVGKTATGPNGKSIFFPAVGTYNDDGIPYKLIVICGLRSFDRGQTPGKHY